MIENVFWIIIIILAFVILIYALCRAASMDDELRERMERDESGTED